MAADPVKLDFYQSKIRITPKDLYLTHPKKISESFGIDYHVVKHNSEETSKIVSDYNLDIGIILGARILKPIAFNNFNVGVINMHPGILPANRGLDNVKWAIVDDLPQGVTAHLIDSSIDRGGLIKQEEIKIYQDDTLVDLNIRIQNLEQKLMIDSLDILTKNFKTVSLGEGTYYKSLPEDIEQKLIEKFKGYKTKWSKK